MIARAADRWLAAYARGRRHAGAPARPGDHRQTVAELLRTHAAPDVRRSRHRPAPDDRRAPATRTPHAREARHGRTRPGRTCSARCCAARSCPPPTPPGRWARSWPARRPRRRSPRFAVALRAKGETPAEIGRAGRGDAGHAGPGRAARGAARAPRVDVVGTGGDRAHTVNISTMAAHRRGRRRASGWSSTATAPPRPRAAPPTCWSTSASRSTSARRRSPAASPRPASASASPPGSTPACGTPARARREMGVPTVLQLPRPADQPGPAHAPARSAASTRGWRR